MSPHLYFNLLQRRIGLKRLELYKLHSPSEPHAFSVPGPSRGLTSIGSEGRQMMTCGNFLIVTPNQNTLYWKNKILIVRDMTGPPIVSTHRWNARGFWHAVHFSPKRVWQLTGERQAQRPVPHAADQGTKVSIPQRDTHIHTRWFFKIDHHPLPPSIPRNHPSSLDSNLRSGISIRPRSAKVVLGLYCFIASSLTVAKRSQLSGRLKP